MSRAKAIRRPMPGPLDTVLGVYVFARERAHFKRLPTRDLVAALRRTGSALDSVAADRLSNLIMEVDFK